MASKRYEVETKKIRESGKRTTGSLGGDIVIFIFLALLGIFMVFPLYYSIIQSLKPIHELFVFPPKLYVASPTADNFSDMFKVASNMWVPFSRYIFNTVFITICGTLGNLIFASMAAYSLAKLRFPGRNATIGKKTRKKRGRRIKRCPR